ncbi:hypothetical protein ACIQJT_04980 [Streptomyces sp. NPDC091972]|uniref:hypothetical protein n=1 Tax=Streptomyces sp. NPDC091972 TaxID=3366007 RepID=UPI0038044366
MAEDAGPEDPSRGALRTDRQPHPQHRQRHVHRSRLVFPDAVAERLPWLPAFGALQPHARLHGIAIRHWDGHWFGADRLWGDAFPHYWSTLTAVPLPRLPAALCTDATDRLANDRD